MFPLSVWVTLGGVTKTAFWRLAIAGSLIAGYRKMHIRETNIET